MLPGQRQPGGHDKVSCAEREKKKSQLDEAFNSVALLLGLLSGVAGGGGGETFTSRQDWTIECFYANLPRQPCN